MAKSKKKSKVVKRKRVVRKAPAKKAVKKKNLKAARKPVRKAVRKPVRKSVRKVVRKSVRKPARKVVAKKIAKKLAVKKSANKAKPVGGFPATLHAAAMKILRERQADEIVSINLAGRSSMADYLIIASGRASRQIAAVADHLRRAFEDLGAQRIRVEGLPQANWVLVDAGDVIVHLFRPEVRRYYGFDSIWDK